MLQRVEEWYEARLGKLTASRFSDAIATNKSGGVSATRKNYLAQLVAERLTGVLQDSFQSKPMTWGKDSEDAAIAAYEFETGKSVIPCGFFDHPYLEHCGASPDGLVDDGLIEIKCPNTSTHIKYLLNEKIPSEHIPQMALQLICTEKKWCEFVSYDPRIDYKNRLFIKRYKPTALELAEFSIKASKFLDDVKYVLKLLEDRNGNAA